MVVLGDNRGSKMIVLRPTIIPIVHEGGQMNEQIKKTPLKGTIEMFTWIYTQKK